MSFKQFKFVFLLTQRSQILILFHLFVQSQHQYLVYLFLTFIIEFQIQYFTFFQSLFLQQRSQTIFLFNFELFYLFHYLNQIQVRFACVSHIVISLLFTSVTKYLLYHHNFHKLILMLPNLKGSLTVFLFLFLIQFLQKMVEIQYIYSEIKGCYFGTFFIFKLFLLLRVHNWRYQIIVKSFCTVVIYPINFQKQENLLFLEFQFVKHSRGYSFF